MFELMKIVGVSAVLSAGFVTMTEIQAQPEQAAGGKIYTDRVLQDEAVPAKAWRVTYAAGNSQGGQEFRGSTGTKADLLKARHGACEAQAWPNVAPECLQAADGTPARGRVRMITVEQRDGSNTSVLMRVPASEIARR